MKKVIKTKNDKNPLEFLQRIETYMKHDIELLKKYGIVKRPIIYFGENNNKIPFLSRIAMKIINKQGGIIDTQFSDIFKK